MNRKKQKAIRWGSHLRCTSVDCRKQCHGRGQRSNITTRREAQSDAYQLHRRRRCRRHRRRNACITPTAITLVVTSPGRAPKGLSFLPRDCQGWLPVAWGKYDITIFKLVGQGVCQRRLKKVQADSGCKGIQGNTSKAEIKCVCLNARSIMNKNNELDIYGR